MVQAFLYEDEKQRDSNLNRGNYMFSEGELKELYKDLDLLKYEEKLGDWEEHGGSGIHRHYICSLIGRKV